MVKVLASPRSVPELIDGLVARRLDGRHAHDEWRDTVMHLATPVTPELGERTARLCAYLMPLADSLGLALAAPATIGQPGDDCRAPAIVVFDRSTPRTAHDALSTAELVIDTLCTDDEPDLAFYANWRVREHLTVAADGAITLRNGSGDEWTIVERSHVLGFDVVDGQITSLRGRLSFVTAPTVRGA